MIAPIKRFALEEIETLYHLPFLTLVYRARTEHLKHFAEDQVQFCTLANIKQGACSEDCKYCSQSSHYSTSVEARALSSLQDVIQEAKAAKEAGSTRFCMGAAWRQIPSGNRFDQVLDMVRAVADLDLEVCCTLGMLNDDQAKALKQAGLTAYNHNLDTSPEFYPSVVSTHTYEERLKTLKHISNAGIQVCCGGILGMGETVQDRLKLIEVLNHLNPQPESTPINILTKIEGTPFDSIPEEVSSLDLVRLIAVTRLVLPKTRIRLSAGRKALSIEAHALCFLAGANSIFSGDKLLTTPNPGSNHDLELLRLLDLKTEPLSTRA
jgi:biotin synthase